MPFRFYFGRPWLLRILLYYVVDWLRYVTVTRFIEPFVVDLRLFRSTDVPRLLPLLFCCGGGLPVQIATVAAYGWIDFVRDVSGYHTPGPDLHTCYLPALDGFTIGMPVAPRLLVTGALITG